MHGVCVAVRVGGFLKNKEKEILENVLMLVKFITLEILVHIW
jgi:hypothetical protein